MSSKDNLGFKELIKKNLINKTYYEDIEQNLKGRSGCKTTADVFDTVSHILLGLSTILAFSAGFFKYDFLSFIAGCLGTFALATRQFSWFAIHKSNEHTSETNRILHVLGMDDIVNITPDNLLDTTEV